MASLSHNMPVVISAEAIGAGFLAICAKPMGMRELESLHDAMTTLDRVLSGQLCQPRFEGEDGNGYNAAGTALHAIQKAIDEALGSLMDRARYSFAADGWEEQVRRRMLLSFEIENSPSICRAAYSAAVTASPGSF